MGSRCAPPAHGQPCCPYQHQHAWNVGLWKLSPPLPAPLWGSSSPTTATGQPEPTPSPHHHHLQPRGSGLLVVAQGPSPCSPAGIAQTPQAPLPRDNPTRQRETPAGAPYAERTPRGGPKPGSELRAAQSCPHPPRPSWKWEHRPRPPGAEGKLHDQKGSSPPPRLGEGASLSSRTRPLGSVSGSRLPPTQMKTRLPSGSSPAQRQESTRVSNAPSCMCHIVVTLLLDFLHHIPAEGL